MTNLQEYLRSGHTIVDLNTNYAIIAKRHNKYNNLVLFKYDQINSPFAEHIVRECRGIILDENNNWNTVARPFDKFFNHGEGHAAKIDWNTARVQEKLDGSLCFIYFYDNQWNVSTSGTPDASGMVDDWGFSFADLFWKTFNEMGLKVPELQDRHLTFIFELTTPYNRIVVRHKDASLTLIGIRDYDSGVEWPVDVQLDYPYVRSFPLQSIEDIENTFKNIDPLTQEGYVTVDANFNRQKIKHPGYVALHHKKDSLCPKNMLELIRINENTEFLTYFPEFADQFNGIAEKFNNFANDLDNLYAEIKHIPDQKEFALKATQFKCSGALFSLRAGKTDSVKQYLADMQIKNLMKLLGLKDME